MSAAENSLEVTGIKEDTAIYVSTEAIKYTLNVHYQYEDGTPAFTEDTSLVVEYGAPYNVATPEITGYTPDIEVVEGTMPAQDVVIEGTFAKNSSGGGNGGNNGGNTPKPDGPYVPGGPGDQEEPVVTIDPDTVPLANAPADGNPADNLILIDDGNVPLAGLPKTGDRAGAHAGLAALLSGFLLAAFSVLNNKKKEENK